jgi:hypothetical protein
MNSLVYDLPVVSVGKLEGSKALSVVGESLSFCCGEEDSRELVLLDRPRFLDFATFLRFFGDLTAEFVGDDPFRSP